MNTDLEIKVLEIDEHAAISDIAAVRNTLEAYMQRGREMMKELDQRMIGWIKENGPIEWETDDQDHKRVFWLGHDKVTKCADVRGCVEFMLSQDLDSLNECLSANAVKHGQFKKLFPEQFDQFFKVEVRDSLESGEVLPKKLQTVNTRFLE